MNGTVFSGISSKSGKDWCLVVVVWVMIQPFSQESLRVPEQIVLYWSVLLTALLVVRSKRWLSLKSLKVNVTALGLSRELNAVSHFTHESNNSSITVVRRGFFHRRNFLHSRDVSWLNAAFVVVCVFDPRNVGVESVLVSVFQPVITRVRMSVQPFKELRQGTGMGVQTIRAMGAMCPVEFLEFRYIAVMFERQQRFINWVYGVSVFVSREGATIDFFRCVLVVWEWSHHRPPAQHSF
ncbi:hypothetical protein ACEU6E_07055 [Halorutilales archaeon Cl-col2-1]